MAVQRKPLQITSHLTARTRGLTTYFTGKPCRYGHVAPRHTSNGSCLECGRLKTKAWFASLSDGDQQAFRERKNAARRRPKKTSPRDEAKAKGEQFYRSDAPCERGHTGLRRVTNYQCLECEQGPEFKAKNSVNALRCERIRREADFEAFRAKQKAQEQARFTKDPKKYKTLRLQYVSGWKAKNPDRARELFNHVIERRRARKLEAGGTFTAQQIDELMEKQAGICAGICSRSIRKKYEIDHKTPLSRGGSGDISNIQLLCRNCNAQKSTRTMEEWLASIS